MPLARIAAINLECTDPEALARFWADVLGGEVVMRTPDYCAVSVGEMVIGAARVDGYRSPTWPSVERSQQLHLDLAVTDLEDAVKEALRLGATVEAHQASPERSRVLRDPAGHPFCLRG
jgi:catechol 2,3-dioxygenase-like lactoylglutathione lyase family enzyme